MSVIDHALEVALKAHGDQKDKAGEPYFFHPVRVALNCDTAAQKVVALLHDVLEDTSVTARQLLDEGFDTMTVSAVEALSRRNGEDYMDFIHRLSRNPLAAQVKIRDLRDNLNLARLGGCKPPKYELYLKALEFLEGIVSL